MLCGVADATGLRSCCCPCARIPLAASLVGKAAPKSKGKAARMLANKLALASRVDALGETTGVTVGTTFLEQVVGGRRQHQPRKEGGKEGTVREGGWHCGRCCPVRYARLSRECAVPRLLLSGTLGLMGAHANAAEGAW